MNTETTGSGYGAGISPKRRHGSQIGAWLLIGLGTLFLLNNLFDIESAMVLLLIGGIFLAIYLNSRTYGFLIPAMIMLGLGVGTLLEDVRWLYFRGDWVPFFLGVGFLGIYVVDRMVRGRSSSWPLWPGGILVIITMWEGMLRYRLFWEVRQVVDDWWPLALVAWGVWMLLKRREAPAVREAGE